MNKNRIIDRLLNPGIVAVIRADGASQLIDVTNALKAGGVIAIEVTMTTPNALEAIRDVSQKFGDEVLVGVGTCLDAATARLAVLAGAQFIVSPVMKAEIIQTARTYAKPIVAGAYTPTEALAAWEAGADFIKIFPADGLGANYIKALKAPLPQLEIIPTGGVDLNTAADFIKAGCAALGVGSSLVNKKLINDKKWAEITSLAHKFVEIVREARKEK